VQGGEEKDGGRQCAGELAGEGEAGPPARVHRGRYCLRYFVRFRHLVDLAGELLELGSEAAEVGPDSGGRVFERDDPVAVVAGGRRRPCILDSGFSCQVGRSPV